MVNEYVLKSHHALAIDNLIQSVFNMHLDIDRKDIGETPEGTGQAEDYRLKLSLGMRANNTNLISIK